jgi:hypothetical protein
MTSGNIEGETTMTVLMTDMLSRQELEDIAGNYKRVAGFQVEGFNAKPQIVSMPLPNQRSGAG